MRYGSVTYRLRMSIRQHGALWSIIGINIGLALVCWLVQSVAGLAGHPAYPAQWLAMPAAFDAFVSRPWTCLTYMFAPTGLLNLLFNMLWLWWFDRVLDDVVSSRRVWLTYISGGVAGAIFCLLLTALSPSLGASALAGPSAAVVAVMIYAALLQPDREFMLFLIGRVRLKWLALISLALLLIGLGGSANAGGQAAHLGGAAAGLSIWLAYRHRPRRHKARPAKETVTRKAPEIMPAMSAYRNDMNRLDTLLDKIKLSGYDSLTQAERTELQKLGERLGSSGKLNSDR